MMHTLTPICPNCDYDLRTQVELQHPGYTANGSPIEIRCDDCGHIFVWPRVTPDKAPRITGITSSDIAMFFLMAAVALTVLFLVTSFSLFMGWI